MCIRDSAWVIRAQPLPMNPIFKGGLVMVVIVLKKKGGPAAALPE